MSVYLEQIYGTIYFDIQSIENEIVLKVNDVTVDNFEQAVNELESCVLSCFDKLVELETEIKLNLCGQYKVRYRNGMIENKHE